jgi:hypothetical protein
MSDQTNYHNAGKVKHKQTPDQSVLKEMFDYENETGMLKRKNGKYVYFDTRGKGYKFLLINNKTFNAARIIWAWHYGDPGQFQIDHINGNKSDNRIENLRLATNSQNNANKKSHRGYHESKKGFRVEITKNRKKFSGGIWKNEKDAAKVASIIKKIVFGEFSNDRIKFNTTKRIKEQNNNDGMLFEL